MVIITTEQLFERSEDLKRGFQKVIDEFEDKTGFIPVIDLTRVEEKLKDSNLIRYEIKVRVNL